MDCQQVEDLLSMYIENELSPELHREISQHLGHCKQCSQLKEKMEDILYTFPELEEEVPFFLKNRLFYIPESQDAAAVRKENTFFYLKWLAAAIGTFVLCLNLFYFTNIYPPAKRLLHSVVDQVKTFTVETGAFLDEVSASDGAVLFSVFKKDQDIQDPMDTGKKTRDSNRDFKKENFKIEIEKKIDSKGGQNG
jgi:hypothetical protein